MRETHESGPQGRFRSLEVENRHLRNEVRDLREELEILRGQLTGVPPSIQRGIFSGGYVRPRLEEEILRSRRYRHYFSILLVQIIEDGKPVREDGTDTLNRYCQRLRGALRGMDLVFAVDGGKIVVLLPETTKLETLQVLERLQDVLGSDFQIAYSIVSFPDDGDDKEYLMNEAFGRLERDLGESPGLRPE